MLRQSLSATIPGKDPEDIKMTVTPLIDLIVTCLNLWDPEAIHNS